LSPRPSRTDAAYRKIKGWILREQIRPSVPIDEQDTARRLGMSRTPVREALLRLQAEGLVEIARGKGIRVMTLSSDDMREIYQLVTGLEVLAVHLLTSRQPSREVLAPLIDAVDAMEQSLDEADVDAWGEADERFHRQLFELCRNGRVKTVGLQYRDAAQRAHLVAARLQDNDYRRKSLTAHRGLVDIILSGDADAARETHFRQRSRGEQALLGAVERYRLTNL
jgi:DNA-binding GntR family transcriptional regulator